MTGSPLAESVQPAKKKGTRNVSTLSAEQLERKRRNDRESQRLIRKRTRDHIQQLEREVLVLRNAGEDKLYLSNLIRENIYLRNQIQMLQSQLRAMTAPRAGTGYGETFQQGASGASSPGQSFGQDGFGTPGPSSPGQSFRQGRLGASGPSSPRQSFRQSGFGTPPDPVAGYPQPYRNAPTPESSPSGWGQPPGPPLSMPARGAPSPPASSTRCTDEFMPGPCPYHSTGAPMMSAGNAPLVVRPRELENEDRDSVGALQPENFRYMNSSPTSVCAPSQQQQQQGWPPRWSPAHGGPYYPPSDPPH